MGKQAADRNRQLGCNGWSLILARLSDDPELADEVLAETRAWIGRCEAEGSLSKASRSDP